MCRTAVIVILLSMPLVAQTSDPKALAWFVPIHDNGDPDYGIRAAGAGFKVSFHRGFEFVPFLGRAYPHNLPFAWRTESVRVGETELAGAKASGRRVRDDRYEYDFGPVIEAYDISSSGVEQTFTIDDAPEPEGELVVTGVVTTELTAPVRGPEHAPLRFYGPSEEAILEYGAATAIDANGEAFPMSSSWDGEKIRLRLTARELSGAVFPLIVDPQVFTITSSSAVGMVRIAIAEGSLFRTIARTLIASAADHDVHVRVYGEDWRTGTTVHSDYSTAVSTNHVSCAGYSIPSTTTFSGLALVAYEMRHPDRTEVRVVPTAPIPGLRTITLTAIPGEHLRSPELAEATVRSEAACLVYDRRFATSSTVRAMMIYDDLPLSRMATHELPMIASTGVEVGPRVAGVDAGTWYVCWAENTSTSGCVRVRRVGRWHFLGPPFRIGDSVKTIVASTRYSYHEPRFSPGLTALTYRSNPLAIGFSSMRVARYDRFSETISGDRSLHAGKAYSNGGLAVDRSTGILMAAYVVRDGTHHEVQFVRLGPNAEVTSTVFRNSWQQPASPDVAFTTEDPAAALHHGQFVSV